MYMKTRPKAPGKIKRGGQFAVSISRARETKLGYVFSFLENAMKAHLETNYQLIYDISLIYIRSEKGSFCKQLFGQKKRKKNDMSKANLSPNDQSVDIITIVNRMLNVPLVFTSVVGNLLVLSTEISNSSLRSTSVVLLSSLTVSDLAVGPLIVQPLYIAARNSQRYLV